jgi:hypothetical protein
MSNADLTAVIDGDTKGLIDALKGATDQMKAFEQGTGQSLKNLDDTVQKTFGNMKNAMGEAKMALGTAAPIAIFNLLHSETQKGIEEFKKIGDAADKAMVSTDFFQALAYGAKEANANFDKVKDGVKTFGEGLGKLKNDEGDLKKSMEDHNAALLAQLKGVNSVEAGMRLMADAIQKTKDPYAQAKLAAEAFGKANTDIVAVLNEGSAGLTRIQQAAQAYGLVVDEHIIRRAQQVKSDFETLTNVIQTKFRMALLNIAPVLKEVGDKTYYLSEMVRKAWEAMTAGSADQLSNTGIADQMKIHVENLTKLRDQLAALKSGKGAGGFFEDWFGDGSDEAKIKKTTAAIEDEIAVLKKLTDERDKRKSESRTAPLDVPDPTKDDDSEQKKLEGLRAMDALMKQYYTDTHQYYQAIEADAQKERDRFKLLLEEKKIDANQYSIAMVLIAKDEATKIEEAYDHTREHIRTAMQSLSGEVDKIFTSWQNGQKVTLQSIERDFIQMIERMVLKASVLEPLFGTGKTGPGEFGLLGGIMQGVAKGGLGGLSSIFSFHDGGIVGEGGTSRSVSPGVFAGAVRYHEGGIAGLMPGEVPAILQAGEMVIPKNQVGSAGGGVSFHIDARGAEIGVETKIQAALSAALPHFTKQAVAAVEQTSRKRPGYLR